LARIFNKYPGEIVYVIAMKEENKETPNYSILLWWIFTLWQQENLEKKSIVNFFKWNFYLILNHLLTTWLQCGLLKKGTIIMCKLGKWNFIVINFENVGCICNHGKKFILQMSWNSKNAIIKILGIQFYIFKLQVWFKPIWNKPLIADYIVVSTSQLEQAIRTKW